MIMCRLFEIYLAGCSGCGIFQLVEAQFVILSVSVFIFFSQPDICLFFSNDLYAELFWVSVLVPPCTLFTV
jgi:hypothetical protein